MVKGTPPVRGTRTKRGQAGVPGNPGFLKFIQIDLRSGREVMQTTKDGGIVSLGNGRVFNLLHPSRMRILKTETKPLQFMGKNIFQNMYESFIMLVDKLQN